MATVASEKLRQDVKAIIKTADLSTLSTKKIRIQLQEKYDTDLSDRKKELDDMILEAFKARQNEKEAAQSGESDNENEAAEETKNGDSQSDSDSEFEEPEDDAPKKKITKKAQQVDDAELAKQLQQEENTTGRRTRNQSKPVRRKPKPKAKPAGGGDGTPKKRTGYSKPCDLSDKLAALLGESEMARSDVIKKMWEIVRERDLLDPKNKQFMLCDDELYKIFGRRRVRTFGMMKYLADHIFKK